MTKPNDFRAQATEAIAEQLTTADYLSAKRAAELTASLVAGLEPLFVEIEARLDRPTLTDTLDDAREVAVAGVRDGVRVVTENLKADGPLVTGAAEGIGKMQGFLSRKAAEARAKAAEKPAGQE